MEAIKTVRRAGVAVCVGLGCSLLMAGSAAAAGGTKMCVPKKEGKPLVTPTKGACKKGYTLTELGAQGKPGKEGPEGKSPISDEEAATLKAVLPYIKYVASGVGGKPTIQFSGVNVQIVNGEGKTESANGEGNVVIGYDEDREGKHEQTGSHNLILGEEQTFTSWGGVLAGFQNTIYAPFASVTGGEKNTASQFFASVGGGEANTAEGLNSSITGGAENKATVDDASISGGNNNNANGFDASVSGGRFNNASGEYASISGGEANDAEASYSYVGGGRLNRAAGRYSSIFGGKDLTTELEYEAVP